jgi:hypothetical protein
MRIVWDIKPYSPVKVKRRFGGTSNHYLQGRRISQQCLPPTFALICCLAYSSIFTLEATCFIETSVDIHQTIRRYIPEDRFIQNYRYENLKSYTLTFNHIPSEGFHVTSLRRTLQYLGPEIILRSCKHMYSYITLMF